jgi:aryl-alcohol dehydrogenase-like predicted oxidoreductase
MEALHDLVKSGKVRYIGASSMWATQFAQMQFVAEKYGWTKFISMQNHYNLLYREEEREMNRYCDAMGVGLIPVLLLPINHISYPKRADPSTVGTSQPWQPCTTSYRIRQHDALERRERELQVRRSQRDRYRHNQSRARAC